MKRADLPGSEAPSAEVLDELLRAFAADTTDAATLQRIDLTSPEVDELISGSPAAPPRPTPEPADDTAEDTADEASPEDLAVDAAAGAVDAPAEEPAVEPSGDEHSGADPAAVEPAPDASPAAVARPTIVIVDHETEAAVEVDAADLVPAGDPLLAAAASNETAPLAGTLVDEDRVFIDDSTVSDAITIEEAVTATRIEPRVRERRSAVKRAKSRKRLTWFLVVVFLLALIVGGLAVLGSGLFAVEDVEVEGADRADPAAVDAVVDSLLGTPVLRVDTDAVESQLEAIPWVQDARVTTDFPHGARIELRERTAAATYQGPDGSFRVIDPEGRVLELADEQPADLLVVSADGAPDVPPGQFAPTGFRAAASLVDALTPTMEAVAESIVVTADGSDVRLLLAGGIEVRFGASQDLVAKLVRLQTWLEIGQDAAVRTVDVSTDEVTTS